MNTVHGRPNILLKPSPEKGVLMARMFVMIVLSYLGNRYWIGGIIHPSGITRAF